MEVIHHANGPYYTQKLYTNTTQYTRKCVNSKWGSWTEDKLTDTNTTYSTFVKSGAGAKAGLVPAPSTTAGTTKYLREDGTWTVPPNTNTWRGIQNNLTSDSTSDSLSAAQGKILKGLVDSKAARNHTHSYLTTEGDNRNTATQPDDYVDRIIFKGLKTKSAINYPSSSAYAYLVGLRGWSDNTGGDSHELVFDNIGIFHRQGSTSWGSWRTILDSNNYSSYAATKNHTHSTATQSANGLMSATDKKKLDEMFGIITITKSLKLTTAWMDTGIAGGNLDSGTYVLQVSGFTYTNNNELYSEVWSGVMTWYKYGTNSGNSDEIILHNAGHADNSNEIYLRTKRNPNDSSGKNGTLSLQIAAKINAKAAENITFKFRRLI